MSKHNIAERGLKAILKEALHGRTLARLGAGALGAGVPMLGLANPTGGQVVAGSATINTPSANGMVVNQGSQRAVINWQQFNVGSGQYVQFVQPNSSAVVLNRVVGNNPSSIFGDILANGQVFLVNTNGIYFAPGASLDVQGLVASTLDIKDGDFMQGRYVFQKGSGAPDASVVNQGTLSAGRGGYIVLAGDYVENGGRIDAQSGRVELAAGNSATLTLDHDQLVSYVVDGATLSRLAGVNNTGEIAANGGAVVMTADVANALTATAVNNSGFIAARSLQSGGGVIVLSAQGGDIENSGTLDASGAAWAPHTEGGTVVIRGDGHTELAPTSVIDAAGNGADGGFIELSGHTLRIAGDVTAGKHGDLLIDPSVIHITNTGTRSSVSVGTGTIGTGFIVSKLNAGSNVTIVASNSISNTTGANINATGAGNLKIDIGTVTGPGCGIGGICTGVGTPTVSLGTGGTINLTGLAVNIGGSFSANARSGSITMDNVSAKGVVVNSGQITVGNLSATGSVGISLLASAGAASRNIVTGALSATAGGIVISTQGLSGNITVNGTVNAAGNFNASASAGGSNNGGNVTLNGAATAKKIFISAFGNNGGGNVITQGLHANGAAASDGIQVHAIDSASAFSDGHIDIAGAVIADNGGVQLNAQGGGDSSGGNIHVSGNITAAKSVDVQAHYIGSSASGGGASIKLANVTGKKVSINTISSHPQMSVGNITATGAGAAGGINLHGSGTGSGSGHIKAGNLTANGHGSGGVNVSLFLNNRSADITLGAISAPSINVSLFGNGDVITGPLTAVSATGKAHIYVSAQSQTGSNFVHVNGAITATGKLSGSSFSIPMPGLDVPVAAGVTISAFGPNGAAHDVKIAGNVNVTANAGAFSHSSPNEVGPIRHFTGSGQAGAGLFQVIAQGSLGSASVGGNIAVTGTDALVMVRGADIKVHGVAATGKGHDIHTKDTGSVPTNIIYASHNTAGAAVVDIGGWSGASSVHGATSTLNAGTIAVSGKGLAQVNLFASDVVAGNITATATAATGTVSVPHGSFSGSSHVGSTLFFRSLADGRLMNGHQTVGLAGVQVGLDRNSGGGLPPPADQVTLGAVTVTGVGRANIDIEGRQVHTKSLSATATKGVAVGSGSFHIGGSFSGSDFVQSFDVNGGEAGINIETGSGSSTSINVAGNVTAKGPTGGGGLRGHDVTVSGNVSIIGSGGSMDVDTHVTSYGGGTYHTHFTGPGEITGFNIGNSGSAGAIEVKGNVSVKGVGIVGVQILGGSVKLGGLSASASAADYSILDTRVSSTPDVFTGGSLLVALAAIGGGTPGAVSIGGDLTLNAAGGVYAPAVVDAGGAVSITAGGDITSKIATIGKHFDAIKNTVGVPNGSSSTGFSSSGLPAFSVLGATDVTMVAGGNIDLTGAIMHVSGEMELVADHDIILSGVDLDVGVLSATASGTIHNGGGPGTITAGALALVAGKDIDMSSTDITIGNGTVPGVNGDLTLLLGLTQLGIAPDALSPNGAFIAGGDLTLGNLTLTGSYLYLQAANVSILGTVSVPKGTLVQVSPIDPTASIGVEDQPGTGSAFNLSNLDFLSLFSGMTIAIGNGAQTGPVTVGADGAFDIGDNNLVIDTFGLVTGLENVTSTGLVVSLQSVLGPPVTPPTSGEIDPSSTGNDTGKDGKDKDGDPIIVLDENGNPVELITQDNSGGGICR
ncbi:MAG TPA: filamentous hemagglutinin N-terminal domain-containing protein [Gammaproteobacteria bacterium]|jgi:filamentous hemagglutinin family protein|nr:filamentous hemagglutinin N-terminal domain-containing protein [Gammaproteobacteria bacterium]